MSVTKNMHMGRLVIVREDYDAQALGAEQCYHRDMT